MNIHKNARLTPKGREILIARLARGERAGEVGIGNKKIVLTDWVFVATDVGPKVACCGSVCVRSGTPYGLRHSVDSSRLGSAGCQDQ